MAGTRINPIAIANTKPVRSCFVMLSTIQRAPIAYAAQVRLKNNFQLKVLAESIGFLAASFGPRTESYAKSDIMSRIVDVISPFHALTQL